MSLATLDSPWSYFTSLAAHAEGRGLSSPEFGLKQSSSSESEARTWTT